MKKLFILIILALGCTEIPEGIVDSSSASGEFRLTKIEAPLYFTKTVTDSVITLNLHFTGESKPEDIWLSLSSADGKQEIISYKQLKDDGNTSANGDITRDDNIYTGRITMSVLYPSDYYDFAFFCRKNNGEVVKIGVHKILYDNGTSNEAPVLSDLNITASVTRGESFIFSVKAADANGYSDITTVFFKLYRPDGTVVIDTRTGLSEFPMDDSGNLDVYGDTQAGDGIYTFKNSFGTTAPTGPWKFEFAAKDKGKKISNILTTNVTVN